MFKEKAIKDHSKSKKSRQIKQVTVLTISLISKILVMNITMSMSIKNPWEIQLVGLE